MNERDKLVACMEKWEMHSVVWNTGAVWEADVNGSTNWMLTTC